MRGCHLLRAYGAALARQRQSDDGLFQSIKCARAHSAQLSAVSARQMRNPLIGGFMWVPGPRSCQRWFLRSAQSTHTEGLPVRERLASAPVILEAATTLFLRNGYLGTSVDDIAALAHVSKQTVYTHFADKEQLFAELTRGNIARFDTFIESVTAGLGDTQALESDLRAVARRRVRAVVLPDVRAAAAAAGHRRGRPLSGPCPRVLRPRAAARCRRARSAIGPGKCTSPGL